MPILSKLSQTFLRGSYFSLLLLIKFFHSFGFIVFIQVFQTIFKHYSNKFSLIPWINSNSRFYFRRQRSLPAKHDADQSVGGGGCPVPAVVLSGRESRNRRTPKTLLPLPHKLPAQRLLRQERGPQEVKMTKCGPTRLTELKRQKAKCRKLKLIHGQGLLLKRMKCQKDLKPNLTHFLAIPEPCGSFGFLS